MGTGYGSSWRKGSGRRLRPCCPGSREHRSKRSKPRFEDGFVAILRDRHAAGRVQPGALPVRPSTSEAPSATVIEVRDLQRRFGDFYAVKGITFAGRPRRDLWPVGGQRRRQIDDVPDVVRVASGFSRNPSGGRSRPANRRRGSTGQDRVHVPEVFLVWEPYRAAEPGVLQAALMVLPVSKGPVRMAWAMEHFELEPYANEDSGGLPLGYKQRLAMACAIMHEPDILFLDEPTSGVDPPGPAGVLATHQRPGRPGGNGFGHHPFPWQRPSTATASRSWRQEKSWPWLRRREIRRQAATPNRPNPTMEDAFIDLIESDAQSRQDA